MCINVVIIDVYGVGIPVNFRAVDCRLNQPEMWLILDIGIIRSGYLLLVESTAVDLSLDQLEINLKSSPAVDG
jgi:hypothetical protein